MQLLVVGAQRLLLLYRVEVVGGDSDGDVSEEGALAAPALAGMALRMARTLGDDLGAAGCGSVMVWSAGAGGGGVGS